MKLKIISYIQYKEIKNVKEYQISEVHFKNYESYKSEDLKWMLAISNRDKNAIFVAISCVTESDMKKSEKNSSNTENGKTVIFKIENLECERITIAQDKNLSEYKEENFKVDNSELEEIIIAQDNNLFEHKEENFKVNNLEPEKIIIAQDKNLSEYKKENFGGIISFVDDKNDSNKMVCFIFNVNGIYRLECMLNNHYLKNFEQFNYPKKLMNELEALYKSKSCIFRIKDCIFDHYFHIEQYTEGIEVMQLYDLKTMQIQQIFNIYEEKNYPNKYSYSILAISKNKQMIAFSSGYGNLALYLIENGLEIIRKDFGKDTKIIACEFINDNKLMIITQVKHEAVMSLWNLYTNKVQDYNDHFKVEEDKESILYSARIPGKYVFVTETGEIKSLYDDIFKIDKLKKEKQSYFKELVLYKDSNKVEESDKILEYENKDHSKKVAHSIIRNREPWIIDDYKKIWVYLDQKKLVQLYIGKCTVQVWRKIEQNEKFVLEYIWVNEYRYDENNYIKIEDLIVYEIEIDIVGHENLMRYACDSLEYLNNQRNKLVGYENQHVFEEIKYNVSHMIERFIGNYPDIWKLLDIHYDLMASIIIGGSNSLVKYILFGHDKVEHKLHIPRITRWTKSKENSTNKSNNPDNPKNSINKSDNISDYMESLKNFKNKSDLSDLQIAIKLCKPGLERNRRILIVTYLLEYYSKNATEHHGWLIAISKALPDLYTYNLGIEISNIIEHTDIIPKYIQIILKAKQKFTAFNPISKLISISEPKFNFKANLKLRLTEFYIKFLPKNYENYSPTVKTVPLYNFTVNNILEKNNDKPSQLHPYLQHIIKLLKLLFIPREYRQFEHHDWRDYFTLFNCIDLASIVVAVIVMSVYVTPTFDMKNAFANVVTTQEITIAISFTMALLWFEFILYLRLISEPAKYIYIMLNIIKETWIFLAFMILVMAGLAHSFLLLLQYPDFTNLTEITTSSTLFTGDSNFKIQTDFDRTEDNPANNFVTSFLSTYNWLNGGFLQQDSWNFWAVKFITFFGSFLLVTILQNMFIAFMGGVYSNAYEKGRVALLRFRAESISDYEALDEIYFYPPPPEPKYIYYIGKSKSYENWDENVKKCENKNLYDDYESEKKNEKDTSTKINELNDKIVELNDKMNTLLEYIKNNL
ncbi:12721_t:CDS:2 [Funneliformis caledonium]|uniref:12721_t:CDS:1 n=1 Tax=Funneliformis caledonium TaxID=1117310 RepID=A0A9N8ZKX2_9GLOM|nr:12721_t:CDS:2 [Funneliformis caledonium]